MISLLMPINRVSRKGKNMNAFKQAGIILMFVLGWAVPQAAAVITIEPDFEGSIVITDPQGKVVALDSGDEIPQIADGSKIEIVEGTVTVHSEAGDQVSVGCGGNQGQVSGSAEMGCSENKGHVKVLQGKVKFTAAKGETKEFQEGQSAEFQFEAAAEEAGETGAGNEGGLPVIAAPQVDSRTLESSPND